MQPQLCPPLTNLLAGPTGEHRQSSIRTEHEATDLPGQKPIEPQFGHDDGLMGENELGQIPFVYGKIKSGNCAFWRPLFISPILATPKGTPAKIKNRRKGFWLGTARLPSANCGFEAVFCPARGKRCDKFPI
jgi:hypothetical protein